MKRFLLALLALVLIIGVLAGVGFLGYRLGYKQGAAVAFSSDHPNVRPFLHGDEFLLKRLPLYHFGIDPHRGFRYGFGPGDFGMMPYGRGFGFFPLIGHLVQLAFFGLIIWIVYKLLTGWRLSFTRTTTEGPRAEPVQPAESETPKTE